MSTTTLTTIATFEMERFSKNHKAILKIVITLTCSIFRRRILFHYKNHWLI